MLEDWKILQGYIEGSSEDLALTPTKAANVFLALETWGYLLSYIVGASMNISLSSTCFSWIPWIR